MLPYVLTSITGFLMFLLIFLTYHPQSILRLVVKMLACVGFISIAISCYHETTQPYYTYILIALCIATFGDLFLGIRHYRDNPLYFYLGITFFSFAHLVYILLFNQIFPFAVIDFIFPLLFLCFVIFYIFPSTHYNIGKKKSFILLYTFLIVLMLCKAMQLFFYYPTPPHFLIALGGLCFFISDSILMHVYFYHKKYFYTKALYILFYYTAQVLFALSILYL